MKILITNIQDQIKPIDTTSIDTSKVIKAAKIIPFEKINSEDGAIIPKEATQMMKLTPSMPAEQIEDSSVLTYIVSGIIVLVVIICIKIILNKIKKKP